MLAPALVDPDPVLIFEHGSLCDTSGELTPPTPPVGLDHAAAIRRPGTDISLITYGGSLPKAHAAADELAAEGINAEVIHLRRHRPATGRPGRLRPGRRPALRRGRAAGRTARRHSHPVGRPPSDGRRRRSPLPHGRRPPSAEPGAAVHRTDALDVVKESIAQVIPDADLVTLGPDDTFRDALEMDSLDFRSFIETLSERTGRPHRRRMHPLPHHALR